MIRIGVVDHEKEYVSSLVRYLQKYSNGKWIVSGFTNQQDLMNCAECKKLDILIGTEEEILVKACKGKEQIQLWLKSEPCKLEEIRKQVYIMYRFQSALEIGKSIERITSNYKLQTTEELACVALYSPVGRCGKTTLATDIVNSAVCGKWIYIGLEDYSSFVPPQEEKSYRGEEFLYYWKEKKEEKVLQMIEETEGFIPSGRSFLDGKSITEEDIKWIKKIPQKRKYKGILFDIGSGVLQSIYLLQTFDVVIVPYLKDTNALAKKHCFETLLEQYEMLEHLRGFLFVDMGDSGAINKVKERLLEGDRL